MFCPNCGKENSSDKKYCRTCGLELEKILQSLVEQKPTKEGRDLQKRRELFDKLGVFSLSSFGILGFSYFFYKVIYFKMILFGAGVLEAFAIAFLFIFGFLTVFFFNYPKFFGEKPAGLRFRENVNELPAKDTSKLLEEKFIEPAAAGSVTENSTELLQAESKTRKF